MTLMNFSSAILLLDYEIIRLIYDLFKSHNVNIFGNIQNKNLLNLMN